LLPFFSFYQKKTTTEEQKLSDITPTRRKQKNPQKQYNTNMPPICSLLIDGDYLIRSGLNPIAAAASAHLLSSSSSTLLESLSTLIDAKLVKPLLNAVGGGAEAPLRVCFFTETLLTQLCTSASSHPIAAGSPSASVETFIAALKANKFLVSFAPTSRVAHRAGLSAVDAAVASRAMTTSLRNAKITTFLLFTNGGLYGSLLEHLANEGKDVFIGCFQSPPPPVASGNGGNGDEAPATQQRLESLVADAIDWAPYLASAPAAPNGIVSIPVVTHPTTAVAPLLLTREHNSGSATIIAPVWGSGQAVNNGSSNNNAQSGTDSSSKSLSELLPSFAGPSSVPGARIMPPPLPNHANPFDDLDVRTTSTQQQQSSSPPRPSSSVEASGGSLVLGVADAVPSSASAAQPQPQQQPAASSELLLPALPQQGSASSSDVTIPQAVLSALPTPSQPLETSTPLPPAPAAVLQPHPVAESPPAEPTGEPPNLKTTLPVGCSIHFDANYRRHYYMVPDGSGSSKSTWQHPLGEDEQRNVEKQVLMWYDEQKIKKMGSSAPPPPPPQAQLHGVGQAAQVSTAGYVYPAALQQNFIAPQPQLPQQQQMQYAQQQQQQQPPSAQSVHHLTIPQPQVARAGPVAQELRSGIAVRPASIPEDQALRWQQQQQQQASQPVATRPAAPPVATEQWFIRTDPAGRVYYANPRTKETAWTLPPGVTAIPQPAAPVVLLPQPIAAAQPSLMYPPVASQSVQPPQQQQQQLGQQQQQQQPAQQHVAGTPSVATQPQQQQQQQRLPPGWEAKLDAATGKTYYIDHNLKKTTWSLPPGY
jgi:hypothetical protein